MSEEKKFENWQEVIVDFFENRISKSNLFEAKKFIKKKEEEIKNEKDEKKQKRMQIAKEKKQNELAQLRKGAPLMEVQPWIEDNLTQGKKDPSTRIKKNIQKGSRIIKATHVLKFTHSSSHNGGILLEEKTNDLLLTTSSFKRRLTLDLAHNNGALISFSRFLGLELHGKLIIDCIFEKNFTFLEPFKENDTQLEKWKKAIEDLIEVEEEREIKTADKAKQIYFPLSKNDFEKYHLIAPLFASSLCNEIYVTINNLKYKEQKKINQYKNHKTDNKNLPKYHQSLYVDYLNLAVQNFGGEHSKNISMLNANRSGTCYLFSSQPPSWQSTLKPPLNKNSMFDNYYLSQDGKITLEYISKFLNRFKNLDLSIQDHRRKKHLIRWINDIIDDWLFYIINIQNLLSGWSKESKLKLEHQYLLDPYRDDEEFQTQLKNTNFQEVVCDDFARWLNKQLHIKDKTFTPQAEHNRLWKSFIKPALREHFETIQTDISKQNKEEL